MTTNDIKEDPYEFYRNDLDKKIISNLQAGGDYEFLFSRPPNRKGEIRIKRLSSNEEFLSSITLNLQEGKCIVKLDLNKLPDDLQVELEDIRELEYGKFMEFLEGF